jgi:hypothetical protein
MDFLYYIIISLGALLLYPSFRDGRDRGFTIKDNLLNLLLGICGVGIILSGKEFFPSVAGGILLLLQPVLYLLGVWRHKVLAKKSAEQAEVEPSPPDEA